MPIYAAMVQEYLAANLLTPGLGSAPVALAGVQGHHWRYRQAFPHRGAARLLPLPE